MEKVGLILALILMLLGVIGIILPTLPGIPLIFLASILYGAFAGWHIIGVKGYVLLGVLTIVSLISDYILTVVGIRRTGGSGWTVLAAIIGAIVGFILWQLPSAIIGLFIGAVLVGFIVNRDWRKALKSGVGGTIGFSCSLVLRFVIAIFMIAYILRKIL